MASGGVAAADGCCRGAAAGRHWLVDGEPSGHGQPAGSISRGDAAHGDGDRRGGALPVAPAVLLIIYNRSGGTARKNGMAAGEHREALTNNSRGRDHAGRTPLGRGFAALSERRHLPVLVLPLDFREPEGADRGATAGNHDPRTHARGAVALFGHPAHRTAHRLLLDEPVRVAAASRGAAEPGVSGRRARGGSGLGAQGLSVPSAGLGLWKECSYNFK